MQYAWIVVYLAIVVIVSWAAYWVGKERGDAKRFSQVQTMGREIDFLEKQLANAKRELSTLRLELDFANRELEDLQFPIEGVWRNEKWVPDERYGVHPIPKP